MRSMLGLIRGEKLGVPRENSSFPSSRQWQSSRDFSAWMESEGGSDGSAAGRELTAHERGTDDVTGQAWVGLNHGRSAETGAELGKRCGHGAHSA